MSDENASLGAVVGVMEGSGAEKTIKDVRNDEREERTGEAMSVLELAGRSSELARVTCVQERSQEDQLRGYFYGDGIRRDSVTERLNKASDGYFSPRSVLEALEENVVKPVVSAKSPSQQLWSEIERRACGELSRQSLAGRGEFIRSHGVEDSQGRTLVSEVAQQLGGLNSVAEELVSRVNGDHTQQRGGLYRDSLVEIEAVESMLARSILNTELDNKAHPSLVTMREALSAVKEFHAYMDSWLSDYQQRVVGLSKVIDGNTDTAGRIRNHLESSYQTNHP